LTKLLKTIHHSFEMHFYKYLSEVMQSSATSGLFLLHVGLFK